MYMSRDARHFKEIFQDPQYHIYPHDCNIYIYITYNLKCVGR